MSACLLFCALLSTLHGTANSQLPEPRAYVPDAGQLDFVYHNHEAMTKFLR